MSHAWKLQTDKPKFGNLMPRDFNLQTLSKVLKPKPETL